MSSGNKCVLSGHRYYITDLKFSPSSSSLLYSCDDENDSSSMHIFLWQLEDTPHEIETSIVRSYPLPAATIKPHPYLAEVSSTSLCVVLHEYHIGLLGICHMLG